MRSDSAKVWSAALPVEYCVLRPHPIINITPTYANERRTQSMVWVSLTIMLQFIYLVSCVSQRFLSGVFCVILVNPWPLVLDKLLQS